MPSITAGSTSVSLYVYFVDDDGGTAPGEPTTGLLFSDIETGGSASYVRQGAARSDFALVTLASASAAWSAGGFILVDDTNMPGVYRVDVPDAAFAVAADLMIVQMVAAVGKNTIMRPLLVMLPDVDFGDAVRAGLTALPNAAADGAFGLPISDVGGLDLDAKLANTDQITVARMGALTDWIEAGRLDAILDIIAADVVNLDGDPMRGTDGANTTTPPTADAVADQVWNELLAGHVTPDSAGLLLNEWQDGGRLDLILDIVAVDVAGLNGDAMRGTDNANTDKTGYALSAAGIDAILDEPITEPSGAFTWAGATLRNIVGWLGALSRNKRNQTATLQTLRNDADAGDISTAVVSDDDTTAVRNEWT
jgi:hypothetical protein